MKKIILKLIRLYQKTLSPDHGPFSFLYSEGFCRFKPTCSEYTYQVIEKYGIILGGLSSFWRICHCHPFASGGEDPMPNKKEIKKTSLKGFIFLLIFILVIYILALILKNSF